MKRKLLPRDAVAERTGLSARTIYRLLNESDFPLPVQVSRGRVAWVEDEIDSWIDRRIAHRDGVPA